MTTIENHGLSVCVGWRWRRQSKGIFWEQKQSNEAMLRYIYIYMKQCFDEVYKVIRPRMRNKNFSGTHAVLTITVSVRTIRRLACFSQRSNVRLHYVKSSHRCPILMYEGPVPSTVLNERRQTVEIHPTDRKVSHRDLCWISDIGHTCRVIFLYSINFYTWKKRAQSQESERERTQTTLQTRRGPGLSKQTIDQWIIIIYYWHNTVQGNLLCVLCITEQVSA